ncbi:MAG TPA: ABC transporter ATP-binding protein [Saprospiraceae bacterium]|nr:ABC transporter ATP-binding protein [Saprospiraceae bacterium]
MIKLINIDKYLDARFSRQFILRGINLEIQEGEFLTIMGPSGAGKSTLLNILGMLDEASAGAYFLNGLDVGHLNERNKSRLNKEYFGYVFQAYHLIDELTVYENIETPLLYRNLGSSQRKSLIADILDRFGMVAKKDLFPDQLSGGQQQLVGVARAVITRPKILLADEPTGNLHSKQAKEIMDMFVELHNEGTTIIQVTHSEENAMYGSRIIELVDGMIMLDKKVEKNV